MTVGALVKYTPRSVWIQPGAEIAIPREAIGVTVTYDPAGWMTSYCVSWLEPVSEKEGDE